MSTHRDKAAFPTHNAFGSDQGMTLLDYFAAAALQGEIACQGRDNGWINCEEHQRITAEKCYSMADAMLAARERKGEP